MNIDTKKIRISSINQEVSETFKSGDQVVFMGSATITEARFKDNFDGSHNATYLAKPELIEIKRSNTDVSVVDSNKIKQKSESQALRQKAFIVAQELGKSPEGLYTEAIEKGHEYLDSLLDEIHT